VIKRFLLDRLDERSTWRAFVAFLTLLGIGLSPEQSDAIIAAGIAIGATLEAFLPDPGGRIHPERLPKSADAPKQSDTTDKAELSHPTSDQSTKQSVDPTYSEHDRAFGPWGGDR
jgi:hypothetical protein